MTESAKTTDHDTIRRWAEARDGHPAAVAATHESGETGILRIDFDPPEPGLERISWDEFFRKFDEKRLAFLYQEETRGGGASRFFKFVARD